MLCAHAPRETDVHLVVPLVAVPQGVPIADNTLAGSFDAMRVFLQLAFPMVRSPYAGTDIFTQLRARDANARLRSVSYYGPELKHIAFVYRGHDVYASFLGGGRYSLSIDDLTRGLISPYAVLEAPFGFCDERGVAVIDWKERLRAVWFSQWPRNLDYSPATSYAERVEQYIRVTLGPSIHIAAVGPSVYLDDVYFVHCVDSFIQRAEQSATESEA